MPEREKGPKKPPKAYKYGRPGERDEPAAREPAAEAASAPEAPPTPRRVVLRSPSGSMKAVDLPPEPALGDFAARALEEVRRLLYTGVTDWAVTNKDTEDIHAILEQLTRDDFMR